MHKDNKVLLVDTIFCINNEVIGFRSRCFVVINVNFPERKEFLYHQFMLISFIFLEVMVLSHLNFSSTEDLIPQTNITIFLSNLFPEPDRPQQSY